MQQRLEELGREEAGLVERLQRVHARAGLGRGGSERGEFSSQDLGRAAALSTDLLLSLRAATGSVRLSSEGATSHTGADVPRPKPRNSKIKKVAGIATHVPTAVAAAGHKLSRTSARPPAATAGPEAPAGEEDSIDRQIDELSARIRRRLDAY
jgi:hypothetical protein